MMNWQRKNGLGISAADESCEVNSADSCIEAGQKSPLMKNILEFSCSDECTCDHCTHFKFAVNTSDEESDNFDFKKPTWYLTPLQRVSKIDFIPSQDSFKLKDVANSYLCDLESKVQRI